MFNIIFIYKLLFSGNMSELLEEILSETEFVLAQATGTHINFYSAKKKSRDLKSETLVAYEPQDELFIISKKEVIGSMGKPGSISDEDFLRVGIDRYFSQYLHDTQSDKNYNVDNENFIGFVLDHKLENNSGDFYLVDLKNKNATFLPTIDKLNYADEAEAIKAKPSFHRFWLPYLAGAAIGVGASMLGTQMFFRDGSFDASIYFNLLCAPVAAVAGTIGIWHAISPYLPQNRAKKDNSYDNAGKNFLFGIGFGLGAGSLLSSSFVNEMILKYSGFIN